MFKSFPLCSLPHWFSWGIYFGKVANKWSRLYWLELRLTICIDNISSKGSSDSSTCNLLSSGTVLIWLEKVTSEWSLFIQLFTWFDFVFIHLELQLKIENPEATTRKVMLKLQFTLISRNELFISMQSLPFSSKQIISLRVVLSFLFLKKIY